MSIVQTQDSQLTLDENGYVLYQAKLGNPLPGEPVAKLECGDTPLRPKLLLLDAESARGEERGPLHQRLESWMAGHIKAVLEPLAALENEEGISGPAKGIAFQVYESLGIVPRADLESLIADLDTEGRQALRARKVRLGPILVFIPALNKPAAVRLRALLWGIHHGKALPMQTPKDGVVSFEIDPSAVDKRFYQAVGYPVFGRRAIRIDMLDRVINAVYDGAENGKFRAQHTMAEWLGCSIDGLYDVLEAMGHRRIKEELKDVTPEEKATEETPEAPSETPSETHPEEEQGAEKKEEETKAQEEKAQDEKPALAMFFLKKGKAFQQSRPPHQKPHKKFDHAKGEKPKGKEGGKGKRNQSTNRTPKIMSTGPKPKPEDSPFAILQQLKKQSDG
ncbi:MAG: hypothetical protein KDI46_08585 [Alphaproteobacteria bacterium]|nr:hypothetical protein [Alphaproteobacteria bacterium]